ncbi:MAG: DNA replication and repair protein RecF [Candidatus Nomurabacteria bacterium]|jgi:DNA replication and repair protein RecF|nr:DNA replication and repair protein RecF [Candidatus Nomurabacteria bacterium]
MDLRIKALKLGNFRSHTTTELIFPEDKNTILITGENGSGKTSILEAIHLCLRGLSFKTKKPEQIINTGVDFGKKVPFTRAQITVSDGIKRLFFYDERGKKFIIGANKEMKSLPLTQRYPTILFDGDDLVLFQNQPAKRRAHLDNILTQINHEYYIHLAQYDKARFQRNALLKSGRTDIERELLTWDEILIKHGQYLTIKRREIISEINQQINQTYQKIAQNHDQVQAKYQTQIESNDETSWRQHLQSTRKEDILRGHTTFGVQKDDMIFYFNYHKTIEQASRGEIRTIILALKFIEAQIIEHHLGKKPIILLDDIFSELDESRQSMILGNFDANQIFITATHPPKNMTSDFILPLA